jgi:uncharacterized membrane protein YccC
MVPALGWVRELLRPKPAKAPWDLAVLTGIAIATPVGIGMATGNLATGTLVSIGALISSLADRGGPYRTRVSKIVAVSLSGSLGFLLGALVFGHPILTVVVVMLAALVSGFAGVIGATASLASLQFMVFTVVGSGISFGTAPVWVPTVLILIGACWRLLLTLLGLLRPGHRHAPERDAVAAVYRALANLLASIGTEEVDARRSELDTAMNTAYDAVVTARSHLGGREPAYRSLMALLNASAPVFEAAVTLQRRGVPLPQNVPQTVLSMSEAIATGSPPPDVPGVDRTSPGLAALASALRTVRSILAGENPSNNTMTVPVQLPGARPDPLVAPPLKERLLSLRDTILSGRRTWQAVLRLVLCLGVAEALSFALPLERPYWITLTVAVVLKPDFGSVFARAIQRGLGTVVGVLLGTVILVVLPYGPLLVLALAILAAAMPIATRRNYGMFSTFLTPVIVILLELVHRDDSLLVVARVADTVIGCAIVLLVGYLPWPDTWRSRQRLAESVADVSAELTNYLSVALGTRDGEQAALRRHTYRRLSDLRTLIQQTLAEPPPVSTQAAAWWPEVVALERLADAITSWVVRTQRGGPRPSAEGVRQIERAAADLTEAIRSLRTPHPLVMSEEDGLAGIASELSVARSALSLPAG